MDEVRRIAAGVFDVFVDGTVVGTVVQEFPDGVCGWAGHSVIGNSIQNCTYSDAVAHVVTFGGIKWEAVNQIKA